jgi:hypothetical protein
LKNGEFIHPSHQHSLKLGWNLTAQATGFKADFFVHTTTERRKCMKRCILTFLAILAFGPPVHGGWFDEGQQKERERREHAEQQLYQQQQTNGGMEIVILVLAVGTVAALVIGAAVGSKARRAVKCREP